MSQVTNNATKVRADKVVAINWQITQGFHALGLDVSEEDRRLAVQLADLVATKDIEKIQVKLVGDEVSIVFDVANPAVLDGSLAPFTTALSLCGYRLAGRTLAPAPATHMTVTLGRKTPSQPKKEVSVNTNTTNPSTPLTSVGAALVDAGIANDPVAQRRDALQTAEGHLAAATALVGEAAAAPRDPRSYRTSIDRTALPTAEHVTPVYPEGDHRPTGFVADSLVHEARTDDPSALDELANKGSPKWSGNDVRSRARAATAALFERAGHTPVSDEPRVDSKMSKTAKALLIVGGVALVGAGIFYGGRRFGFFGGSATGEAAATEGVIPAVVNALRR